MNSECRKSSFKKSRDSVREFVPARFYRLVDMSFTDYMIRVDMEQWRGAGIS